MKYQSSVSCCWKHEAIADLGIRWGKTGFTRVKGTLMGIRTLWRSWIWVGNRVFLGNTYKICLCRVWVLHPARFSRVGNLPATPLGRFELPGSEVWVIEYDVWDRFAARLFSISHMQHRLTSPHKPAHTNQGEWIAANFSQTTSLNGTRGLEQGSTSYPFG